MLGLGVPAGAVAYGTGVVLSTYPFNRDFQSKDLSPLDYDDIRDCLVWPCAGTPLERCITLSDPVDARRDPRRHLNSERSSVGMEYDAGCGAT